MRSLTEQRLFSNQRLIRLIIPLVIEQALTILVGMCDGVMVSSVGEAAISGVSLVDMINNVILVLFAALTSAISLVETLVSIVHDGLQCTRAKALGIVIAFVVIAGAIINAGYNGLSFIEPLGAGSSILDFADFISNSVLMPIVALLTCVFVGWIVKPKTIIDEVRISSKFSAAGAWTIMIKYIAPVLVIIILVAYVAAQFGFFSM